MKGCKRNEVSSPGPQRTQAFYAFAGRNSAPSCRSLGSRRVRVDTHSFRDAALQSTTKIAFKDNTGLRQPSQSVVFPRSKALHDVYSGYGPEVTSVPSVKLYNNVKSRYLDYLKKDYDRDGKGLKGCMDWKKYHRLGVIHEFLDDLDDRYPSICSTGIIGSSLEGRDLKVLKISNSEATNASVWMDAGIHAREWIAPAVATYIANHIAVNFKSLPTSITNKDWYFLPVMNPDGYEFSHTTTRLWRKNRAWHGGRCLGVDLNRNFSYGWGGRGSSDDPTSPFYRGPEPFSEPEACAVRDMLIDSGVDFKIYITLHSYGQVILFPYACKDELCPDYVRLLEGATAMSKNIFEASGNTYKVGVSRDIMYGASGTSNDWSYSEANIPFCYLIELRSKQHKFKVPQEEIEDTGNEILKGVFGLMEYVDASVGHGVQIRPKLRKRLSFGFVFSVPVFFRKPGIGNDKLRVASGLQLFEGLMASV